MIAPFSGTEYDLAAAKVSFAAEGKRIEKLKQVKTNPLYESLKAVARKLLELVDQMSGRSNHELKTIAREISAIIQEHEL